MNFLSIIAALALVQWWGSGAPLQRDQWFYNWIERLEAWEPLKVHSAGRLLVAILGPCLVLWLLIWALASWWGTGWVFFIAVPVLLFSLGRGEFSSQVKSYVQAGKRGDSVAASQAVDQLRGNLPLDTEASADDWETLNREALSIVSYRGFERMFAVLFWFLILGPVGALLYRLSSLYLERHPDSFAKRWLWLLEWPAVRLMGFTWAMAGNFDTCFSRWQRNFFDVDKSSQALLQDQLRGALGEPTEEVYGAEREPDFVTEKSEFEDQASAELSLIKASLPLFSRSLLLWVCVLALVTLLL